MNKDGSFIWEASQAKSICKDRGYLKVWGGISREFRAFSPAKYGYKSAWWICQNGPAFVAPIAGPPLFPEDAWQRRAAGYGEKPTP